jgi:photosystem II stability/assembly factor-like uncharacterized protein
MVIQHGKMIMKTLHFMSFTAAVFLSLSLATSQQNSWQYTGGPYKGLAHTIATGDHGLLLAGTNTGLFRSTDYGETWNDLQLDFWNIHFPSLNTVSIAPNGFVYILARDSTVYRSSDHGDTWTSLRSALHHSPVKKLVFSSHGEVFALVDSIGILYSTDQGDNWSRMNHTLPISRIYSFAVDSTKTMLIAADTNVYRSTDNGSSWNVVNKGLLNKPNLFAFNSEGHIFAGGSGIVGIYRSTDNGNSWSPSYQLKIMHPVKKDSVVISTNVLALAIDSDGTIFANRDQRIIRSTDNGNTWEEISSNFISRTGVRVLSFALNSQNDIFAGTIFQGIVRSQDHGDHWTPRDSSFCAIAVKSIVVDSQKFVFAGTDYGVVRSMDNSNTWMQVSQGLPAFTPVRTLALNSQRTVFAGVGSYDIYRSLDKGDHWTALGPQGACFGINAQNVIFSGAGIEFTRAYRSGDNGDHWTRIDSSTILNLLSFAFNSDGHIFAGSSNGVIFRSTDQGAHWTELGDGLPYRHSGNLYNIGTLAINSHGHIFAGTDFGLYRSTDNGNSWETTEHNLPPSKSHSAEGGRIIYHSFSKIHTIIINARGYIFVGYDRGVFLSKDNGETWIDFNQGLRLNTNVCALALTPDGYLLAGTDDGAVFKTIETTQK